MPKFSDSTTINVSAEQLWGYLTTREDILQWFEGLDTLQLSADYPAVGATQTWTYKVMGVEFKGKNTVTTSLPGARITYQMEGLMNGTMDYQITPVSEGVKLEFEVDYTISGGVLGKLAEPVAHQMNVGNGKKSLENLKRLAES